MANITAKDVAELRAKTGLGMMDCKKALVEAEGDMDKAITILREKGLATAAKKESRIAADGIVKLMNKDNAYAMIEVNSETDFVAKNASFQEFVDGLLETILESKPADVDALLKATYVGTDSAVESVLVEKIAQIGEKLSIRRFVIVEGNAVATYVHGNGSIGVLVKFDTDVADKDGFAVFAKNIALQIGAYPTPYLNREQVPASVLEEEKNILLAQIANDPANAKKPDAIKEKMVQGRISKFYDNNCLVDMTYVKDEDMKVGKYVESVAKELGGHIAIVEFFRFEKGEGIQKREENFAEEIAKMTAGK
ncbi:MAG: elongation factor Ts [Ruminococcaceae bacterium]|nr:elongation factor Ts [Oscillospiraceae bacterium]